MPITIGDRLCFCGHSLTQQEVDLIRGITREFSNLTVTELAATISELLGWKRPNGKLKTRECYLFLLELRERGWLPWLPAPQARSPRTASVSAPAVPAPPVLDGDLCQYRPLRLDLIEDADERKQFRQYLDQYHYLGYQAPYGAQLRYFVRAAQADLPPLAALLFTSAAWRMAPRDQWIGWQESARLVNLPRIVNHSRFLILPWARIPHLASHILSRIAQQLPGDWNKHYAVEPVLLETLVDVSRYRGVCYRAANWIEVGTTKGRGRMDRLHQAALEPKRIFLFPLHRRWRQRLCDPAEAVAAGKQQEEAE
jgi:Domain of unknown function (DUF4338)